MKLKALISGRMNRLHFAIYWSIFIVVKLLLIYLAELSPGEVALWGMRIVDVSLSLALLCAMIKRFHDLGWPTFFVIIPLLDCLVAYKYELPFFLRMWTSEFIMCFSSWASLTLMLCCLFLSGSKEDNRYGPSHPKEKDRFQEADADVLQAKHSKSGK